MLFSMTIVLLVTYRHIFEFERLKFTSIYLIRLFHDLAIQLALGQMHDVPALDTIQLILLQSGDNLMLL